HVPTLSDCLVFFFSSRRRHTRSKRDWSSDVCSSDLNLTESSLISLIYDSALTPFLSPFSTDSSKYSIPTSISLTISLLAIFISRSEERRVGKECISML